ESRRIGPVESCGCNGLTALQEGVVFYLCKRTRTCDTGHAGVMELVTESCVERGRCDTRLPLAIGRAGMLLLARYVALVLHLKGFYCTANIHIGQILHGIAYADIADLYAWTSGLRRRSGKRRHAGHIELISDVVGQVERLEVRVPELEGNGMTPSDEGGQS